MSAAELSMVPRTCGSCGASVGAPEDDAGFTNLCVQCNELAAPYKIGRRAGRLTQAECSARRRATNEPRVCPYCGRHHEGEGLAEHLLAVHQATMILSRSGYLVDDDPQATESIPTAQRSDSDG
jgi:hypothetical protein